MTPAMAATDPQRQRTKILTLYCFIFVFKYFLSVSVIQWLAVVGANTPKIL